MSPSLAERTSVTETKIENLEEKLDDVKDSITELRDSIRESHTQLQTQLQGMQEASTKQHGELAEKIKNIETLKDKWIKILVGVLAFAAGAGWLHTLNLPLITKFLGL